MADGQYSEELGIWDRAMQLAAQGRGSTSPNPNVGAVIARQGEIIGEGWHRRVGEAHAEREAIADAESRGHDVAGATMYVTLEPCAHEGRQPPCAELLVEKGLAEVVIGCPDPNPKTAGRGPRQLRDAGIKVREADPEVADRARLAVQEFRKHVQTGKPLVTLKMAMSLDGRVATDQGDSRWISSPESRRLVHEWRAASDAVAVGSGTVRDDDPRLTAREVEVERQPARVLFVTDAVIPEDAAVFEDIDSARLIVIVGPEADPDRISRLEADGAEVLTVDGEDRSASFSEAMSSLGSLGFTSLLLEGGPVIAGAALAGGEVDRLELFVAPILLGSGRSVVEGEGVGSIADAPTALETGLSRVGPDLLVSARLKEW